MRILRLLITLFLLVIVPAGFAYVLYEYKPELAQKLLISVDIFGLTESGRDEQGRRKEINALKITYEEKQALLNRTVFMDASQQMVRLALGEPKKSLKRTLQDGREVDYFVYYLPNDKRPTILVFLQDKLAQAYKGSAIDIQ